MDMFGDFTDIEFPQRIVEPQRQTDIVYVLYFIAPGGKPVYFYVGQSTKGLWRLDDYLSGQFSATTDFKVKQGIEYLRSQGFCSIRVKYKECRNPRNEEKAIICHLLEQGFCLLNCFPGYEYIKNRERASKRRA